MPQLLVQLALDVVEQGSRYRGWMEGLAFHRWLPDGESDAIAVDLENRVQLRLWFERTGYVSQEFIEFDRKLREVDPGIVARQGLLFANPLRGYLEIPDVPDDACLALRDNKRDSQEYRALARRIVKLLDSPLEGFVGHLRNFYGQRWLTAFRRFDSRETDIASRCVHLNLRWSLDGGVAWTQLIPSYGPITLSTRKRQARDFLQYITRKDWAEIGKADWARREPSVAAQVLARARELADESDIRGALIEAVTALEIALDDFIRRTMTASSRLKSALDGFGSLRLEAKLGIVAASIGVRNATPIELALDAVSLRNKVVHEGWDPKGEHEEKLKALLDVIVALLPGEPKSPDASLNNWVRAEEEWEQDYAREAPDLRSPFGPSR